MKNKLLFGAAALLVLAGCSDFNDKLDGFVDGPTYSDVKNQTYTLTDADYATVAKNSTNQSIAAAADPTGSYTTALNKVSSNKYLTDIISGKTYLPAFLAATFPTADNGSSIKVTYNKLVGASEYISKVQAATSYKVSAKDYQNVWGSDLGYFTPSKTPEKNLPKILSSGIVNPTSGQYAVVEYQYSSSEATSTGVTYDKISDITSGTDGQYTIKGTVAATYARGFMVNDGTGYILVYLGTPADYSIGDVVSVSGTTTTYSGLHQFTNSAVVARLEGTSNFAYPTAKEMTGSDMDAYLSSPTVKYVKVKGTLTLSGNYINLTKVEGSAKASGSISYPNAGIVNTDLKDKEVYVVGYTIGYSSTRVNFLATSIYAADATPEYTAIGTVASSAAGTYTVKGTVAALYNKGFLVNDGTGTILVYLNATPSNYAVGDLITVSGTTSVYGGVVQFPKTAAITKLSSSTFTYPTAQAFTTAMADTYVTGGAPYTQYMSIIGKLNISGNYYNLAIDGASTAIGSISYPMTGLVDAGLNGKYVKVTGYCIGVSSSKYLNIMATKVEDANGAENPAGTSNTGNSVKQYAVYQYNGTAWAPAEGIAIVNPADYKAMGLGTEYFNATYKADGYLPNYLKQKYPYAFSNDKVGVAYFFNNGTTSKLYVDEYVCNNGTWTLNNNIVQTTDQFVLSNGKWNYDPSVVVTLNPGKGQPAVMAYYQAIADYVGSKIGTGWYQTGYTNAECYYGSSAYYNEFDLRISYLRTGSVKGATEYANLSDADLTALVMKRLPEAFIPALEKLHSDAAPVSGVDVTYTIKFGLYTGVTLTAPNYTITYKVIGNGKFEYVANSLKAIQ